MRTLFLFNVLILLVVFDSNGFSQNIKINNNKLSNTDFVEVVSIGLGKTADEALKNAYRSAVYQVVGAMIDSTTLVQNDKLVEDKLLAFSGGYVENHEEIPGSKKFLNGIYEVKIKAFVKKTGLNEDIKKEKILASSFINGKTMANDLVKQISQKDLLEKEKLRAQKEAIDFFLKKLDITPTNFIVSKLKENGDYDKKGEILKTNVVFEIDQNKYKQLRKTIEETLEKIATKKDEIEIIYEQRDGNLRFYTDSENINYSISNFETYFYFKDQNFYLSQSYSNQGQKNLCKKYELDFDFCAAIREKINELSKDMIFKIKLIDSDGETITFQKFSLSSFLFTKNSYFYLNSNFILNLNVKNKTLDGFRHSPEIKVEVDIPLSIKDLSRVKEIKLEVVQD